MIAYTQGASSFMTHAYAAGVGGEGYLWMGSDTLGVPDLWRFSPTLAANETTRERVLKGTLAIQPAGGEGPLAEAFLARRAKLASTSGSELGCNMETDADGNLLWASDHDLNQSTPLRCSGFDSQVTLYDGHGYDAVFAVAHALHDLIHHANVTRLSGPQILQTLIERVNFVGVTGLLNFFDASDDPLRLYQCAASTQARD